MSNDKELRTLMQVLGTISNTFSLKNSLYKIWLSDPIGSSQIITWRNPPNSNNFSIKMLKIFLPTSCLTDFNLGICVYKNAFQDCVRFVWVKK